MPDDPFTVAFWRITHEEGLQNEHPNVHQHRWQEFLKRFSLVTDILEAEHGIKIDREDYRELRNTNDLPWLAHEVQKASKPWKPKLDAAAIHDAMNYLLIQKRRQNRTSNCYRVRSG